MSEPNIWNKIKKLKVDFNRALFALARELFVKAIFKFPFTKTIKSCNYSQHKFKQKIFNFPLKQLYNRIFSSNLIGYCWNHPGDLVQSWLKSILCYGFIDVVAGKISGSAAFCKHRPSAKIATKWITRAFCDRAQRALSKSSNFSILRVSCLFATILSWKSTFFLAWLLSIPCNKCNKCNKCYKSTAIIVSKRNNLHDLDWASL